MNKEIEIPEGYEARIEGNKVILEPKENEDERIRKNIVETIKQCPDTFLNPKNRDRMLAYLERQKEQKPTEWSEEDEKALDSVLSSGKTVLTESNREWLKSLPERFNLQFKQEWSEEDEKKLTTIISLMRSNRAIDPFYDKMCLESWLKSLRPSWKPSEEQISALERAIVKMHTPNDISILAELRDNLKKL